MQKVYIFGAHSRAQTLAVYLESLYPEIMVEAFLYSNEERNPERIGEVPVLFVDEYTELNTRYPVYIGTRGIYHPQITEHLRSLGFKKLHPITVELDRQLRNAYLKKYFTNTGRSFSKIEKLDEKIERSVAVYVVRSVFDKPLKQPYELASYEKEIQAGAALTRERLSDNMATDDTGKHISARNKQFCELTALYWIWKNRLTRGETGDKEVYYGLSHYRRMLELSEDDLSRLIDNDVDAVLPYPMSYEPDIEEHHKRYLADADWKALCRALEELQPEYAGTFGQILKQQYFYNYNIILARKSVLEEYCSWLFPILERVEQLSTPKGWERQDRYIGYMGETLETLYFMHNRNRLNITHAGCRFLL